MAPPPQRSSHPGSAVARLDNGPVPFLLST